MFNVSIMYYFNYTCLAINKSLHNIINAFNAKMFQELQSTKNMHNTSFDLSLTP